MRQRQILIILIVILSVLLAALLGFVWHLHSTRPELPPETEPSTTLTTEPVPETTLPPTTESTTEPTTEPITVPTEPPIVKESTATIGATGDILLHELVIKGGYDSATGTYDYNYMFEHFSQIAGRVDYAVANLEVTLCSDDNGYNYSGYPCFNSPDTIVEALQNAGFDMLLTANNHSYDTRNKGFMRTQQVIDSYGLDRTGTRQSQDEKNYIVRDVNGIRIGMINYTYNTSSNTNGKIALNGINLTEADSALVNSFSYYDLDTFYQKLEGELDQMRNEGAEAIVLFIHWGDEYKTTPNSYQTSMAQRLCDLGIDVIVGNHAHVPQGVELLTSREDESHKTLCLYSTGNAVSNIYRGSFPVNTEDGMFFSFTFAKYSDGTVVLESAEVIPTWVYRYYDGNWTRKFLVLTMEEGADWQAAMDLSDSQLSECEDSYERTMGIVGEGLDEANEYFAQNQAAVEAELGVQ